MAVLEKDAFEGDDGPLSGGLLVAPTGRRSAVARRVAQIAIPRELALILAAIGLFVAAALAISAATGAPFVVPTEQTSPAVGAHFTLPILLAAAAYLIAQAVAWLLERDRSTMGVLVRNIGYDYLMLGLFVVVMVVHFHIKMWVPIVHPHMYDADYMAVDNDFRFVIELFTAIRGVVARVLPGADAWYELAFFGAFVMSFVAHSLGQRRWLHHNMAGILLVEMIGPLTYLIAPAAGPFIYEHGPNAIATKVQLAMYQGFEHVQAGGSAWLAAHGGDYFTQPLAAMPSLHVAATLVMCYYARRARLLIAPLLYVVLGWIVIESVVTRWHYLIDVPFGVALAVLVIFLTNRMCRVADDEAEASS